MPTFSKVSRVCIALALPGSVILAYYLYRKWSASDEEIYGKKKVVTSRNTVIEVMVPQKAVGAVIGRQGTMIKQIQKETGARVSFKDRQEAEGEVPKEFRTALIQGTPESAQQAELMIHQIIADLPEVLTEVVDVPGYSIGRLIGKGGCHISEMYRISGAKITIDRNDSRRSPEELRSVTLCGSRHQIDVALELIQEHLEKEEEFRAKMSLSAANRGTRNKTVKEPLKTKPVTAPDAMWDNATTSAGTTQQDRLPLKDSFFEVYVSAVEHPGHFWVQQIGTKALHLEQLQNDLTNFASSPESQQYKVTDATPDQLVGARYDDNDPMLYRAKVIGESPDGLLDLYFVDYGDNAYREKSQVVKLRSDFAEFPFQAIECCLAGVQPNGDEWSEDAITLFEDLTFCAQWKVIFAKVVGQGQGDSWPRLQLVDTSGEKDIDVAKELVRQGFAMDTSPPTSQTSTKSGTQNPRNVPSSTITAAETDNTLQGASNGSRFESQSGSNLSVDASDSDTTSVKKEEMVEKNVPLENAGKAQSSNFSKIAIHRYV